LLHEAIPKKLSDEIMTVITETCSQWVYTYSTTYRNINVRGGHNAL